MILAAGALLSVVTILLVYDPTWIGMSLDSSLNVLWVAIPLGMLLMWIGTRPKANRFAAEIERFAKFELPDEPADDEKKPKKRAGVLNKLTAPPKDFGSILERTGDGEPITFFEIHPRLAYVAITGTSPTCASECTSIVMKLDAPAPTFEARPIVAIDPPPAKIVEFKKDLEFTTRYVVEGDEAKRIRAFLCEPLREELVDEPSIWVEADQKFLALSIYGDFDRARTLLLLETADVFFAEYGAGGGPSLLEPESIASATKKKKKKTAKPAPTGDPEESPA